MKDYSHIVQKLSEKYPDSVVRISEAYEYNTYGEYNHLFAITVFKSHLNRWYICDEFATETELENYIKTLEL